MAPRPLELEIWSGNTFRQKFGFQSNGAPFDLTGSKLVFRAVYGTTTVRKATDDDGGEVELFFSVAETRAFPEGAPAMRYEIERWIGDDQISLLYGSIKVTKWVNDDVDP
jgi:hypothetical protein